MAKKSIKTKLVFANMSLLILAFVVVGSITFYFLTSLVDGFLEMNDKRSGEVVTLLGESSERTQGKISEMLTQSLERKGRGLIEKDVLAIKPLFLENSVYAVKSFVQKAYDLDSEIVYGAFFTAEEDTIKAWQVVSRQFPKGMGIKVIYDRENRRWLDQSEGGADADAAGAPRTFADPRVLEVIKTATPKIEQIDYDFVDADGKPATISAYDCFVPVFDGDPDELAEIREEGEPIGYLRYVVSRENLELAIAREQEQLQSDLADQEARNQTASGRTQTLSKESRRGSLTAIFAAALLMIALSFFLAVLSSRKIVEPLESLGSHATMIADGDYGSEVRVTADDEIGDLAAHFETMRQRVKKFAENLQELVDERTKEISDIMRSISQGIFTVSTDFEVQSSHSRLAEEFFGTDDFANAGFQNLLQVDDEKMSDFQAWMQILDQAVRLQQWKKFEALAPVLERDEIVDGKRRVLRFGYEPIIDKDQISKVMVLAEDITDAKVAEENLARAKAEQHEQMERVAALITADRATITTFLVNANAWVEGAGGVAETESGDGYVHWLRAFHTLNGQSGMLGLSRLKRCARAMEDLCDPGVGGQPATVHEDWQAALGELLDEVLRLQAVYDKLFGAKKDLIEISRSKYQGLVARLSQNPNATAEDYLEDIRDLDSIPFSNFAAKYGRIVSDYRENADKKVADLEVDDPDAGIHREVAKDFDVALVHVIRNALDHGIEGDATRAERGKGPGRVRISYEKTATAHLVKVCDDGGGMDRSKILARALENGLVAKEAAESMEDQEVYKLIFSPGFSTKEELSEVSGRGVGMSAALDSVVEKGGSIVVFSKPGEGSEITLSLPRLLAGSTD